MAREKLFAAAEFYARPNGAASLESFVGADGVIRYRVGTAMKNKSTHPRIGNREFES
jgi:hypothetical protein